MVNERIFILMLIIHFLADFCLQTNEQAVMKGISNKFLFYHVGAYSLMWLIASYAIFLNIYAAVIFSIVTFICHFITDYFTSRIGKPFWEKKDFHNGFVVVGFDQILHYLQMFYTFKIILSYL